MSVWGDAAAALYASDIASDATYTLPGGSPRTVRVILDVRRDALDVDGALMVTDTTTLWCRTSEVSDLKRGDTFTIDGVTWTVVGDPVLDETAGEWRAEVSRA